MERGHQITFGPFGHVPTAVAGMIEDGIDGVLILTDDDTNLEEIAARFTKTTGRPVWRNLTDIPPPTPGTEIAPPWRSRPHKSTAQEERTPVDEKKRIKSVAVAPAPARRWWVILEYDNHSAEVESTQDAHDDAIKRAKELAAEHKVGWVQR
jgi:hypothetical protein